MKYNKNIYSIVPIIKKFIFFVISIALVSCVKDESLNVDNTDIDNEGKIKITIADFGDNSFETKSSLTREIYTKSIALEEGEIEVKVIEDSRTPVKDIVTKMSNLSYTILIYDKNGNFYRQVTGTATDEGYFNLTGPLISTAGTYTFVCVAGGTINSDKKGIIFGDYMNNKPRYLISDPITRYVSSTIKPSLNFIMRHKESGLRVQINSENEVIPSTMDVAIHGTDPIDRIEYDLPTGVIKNISTRSIAFWGKFFEYSRSNNSLTTEYKYFFETTGKKQAIYIEFSGVNDILGYNKYNKISLVSLPSMVANKRYTIVLNFKKYPDLTDLTGLPFYKVADYNMKQNGTFTKTNRSDDSFYFSWYDAVGKWGGKEWGGKEVLIEGKYYHLPTYYECMGLFYTHGRYFTGALPSKEHEFIQIGYNTEPKWYSAYYQGDEDNADIYGIKLINKNDYSKVCAYRYSNWAVGTNITCVKLTVIYLGNKAKKYIKGDLGTGKMQLDYKTLKADWFNNNYGQGFIKKNGQVIGRVILFPVCGWALADNPNTIVNRDEHSNYWTYSDPRIGEPGYIVYFGHSDAHVCHVYPVKDFLYPVRLFSR